MPVLAAFRAVYESAYGVAQEQPAEFVTYRVRAVCPFAAASRAVEAKPPGRNPRLSRRPVHGGRRSRPRTDSSTFRCYRRADLADGHRLPGPALVEGPESTTLVPPGALLTVDALGTMNLWPDGKDLA